MSSNRSPRVWPRKRRERWQDLEEELSSLVLQAVQAVSKLHGAGAAGRAFSYWAIAYSRKQADESIQDYFQEQNIVGISDIDTRQLVRHIRDKGAMNAIISSEILDMGELKKKLA